MSQDPTRDKLASALGAEADHVVMERGYSLAFVGVHGQVRLIQFRLSKKGFSTDRAADDARLRRRCSTSSPRVVDGLLRERWGGIALRAALRRRGRADRAPLRRGHTWSAATRSTRRAPAGRLVKDGEIVDARELLVRASARLVENWGVFEQAPRLDDGAFAHEAKCAPRSRRRERDVRLTPGPRRQKTPG